LNQPSLKDLVLGQAKINENLTKKLLSNDKVLENINTKIENLASSVQNQLSFNTLQKIWACMTRANCHVR
jgi:hypothetical protein